MAQPSETSTAFEIKFTPREVSAWGGLALMKRILASMNFRTAASQWDLPEPRWDIDNCLDSGLRRNDDF